MLPNQLLNRYSQGERNFSGIDLSRKNFYRCRVNRNLSGVDFSKANFYRTIFFGVDLSNATLKGANLQGAKFHHCKLQGVDFSDADMTDALLHCQPLNGASFDRTNLSRANLSDADLNSSTLVEANLTDANLLRTNLSESDLRKVVLEGAVMSRVNLSKANLSAINFKQITLLRANLSHANLRGAHLRYSDLSNANLMHADLTNADLSYAQLSTAHRKRGGVTRLSADNPYYEKFLGANLTNANLNGANLSNANLTDAVLQNTDLTGAKLNNANFTRTSFENVTLSADTVGLNSKVALVIQLLNTNEAAQDLNETDLSEINLNEIDLSGSNLSRASFVLSTLTLSNLRGAALKEADLSNSNLSYSDLSKADLTRANLRQANLSGADLIGANLQGANLTDADLRGANLTGANLSNATLSAANAISANLSGAILIQTDCSYAKLNDVDFTNVDLGTANLTEVSAFNAKLKNAIQPPKSLLFSGNSIEPEAVKAIREAASGLTYTSDGDAPYEIFFWSSEVKGEFSLEGLLKSMGYIRTFSVESFFNQCIADQDSETQQLSIAIRRLATLIEPYVNSVEIWALTQLNNRQTMLYLILSQTVGGDWLGMTIETSSKRVQDASSSPDFFTRDNTRLKSDYVNLLELLQSAVEAVNITLPNSNTTKRVIWELCEQRQATIQNLLLSSKQMTIAHHEEDYFKEDFFEYLYADNEYERAQRQTFSDLFYDHAHCPLLYRIGGTELYCYLMGKTQDGDWIGVRTRDYW